MVLIKTNLDKRNLLQKTLISEHDKERQDTRLERADCNRVSVITVRIDDPHHSQYGCPLLTYI